jgi:quinol monooxygenase YgiN
MLTHVVLFKLRPEHKHEAPRCRDLLLALPPQIDEIRHYEVGLNVIESDRAYDFALYSKFDSIAAMQTYQVHPAHQAVVQVIVPLMASVIAVDYES